MSSITIKLVEMTCDQVVGFNKRAILDAKRKDPNSTEFHAVQKASTLQSLLAGVFYRDYHGTYLNQPLEKMAALLLYRIAETQCFANGNKRTALLSCTFFLYNNGYNLKIDRGRVNDLLWGFAKDMNNPTAPVKYNADDALEYIEDNISVRH